MKTKFILIILLLPFLLFSAGSGGTGGEYLATYGSGARPLGMGGAFTGQADDATAIYYNPAGLSTINRKEIYTLFSPIFPGEDVNLFSASYVHPLFGYGRMGISWLYLSSGGYIGRDWRGYTTGITYSENINTFLLSYASPMYKQVLSGGINMKFIFHSIEGLDRSYFGFGIDLAGYYRPFKFLSTGLMIQNILPPKMKLSDTEEYFPINLRLGIAGHFLKEKLNVTADVNLIELFPMDKEKQGKMQVKYFFGAEYNFLEMFAVRAGYNFKEITGGFGINYWGMRFDYAYAYNYHALTAQHQYLRVSLIVHIDELPIFKAPKGGQIISTTHLVMGNRPKKLKTDKKLDSKIKYETIDCHDSEFTSIRPFTFGMIVDNYYTFLKNAIFDTYKFIIPVQESGFTYVYDSGLLDFVNKKKDFIISFSIPGTYVNLKDSGPVDIKKSSKFIKDALLHYKKELKLPVSSFEIAYPEKCFVKKDIITYQVITDNVIEFIKKNKLKLNIILPNFIEMLDNKNITDIKIIKDIKKKYEKKVTDYVFEYTYENPLNKNNVKYLKELDKNFKLKFEKIEKVFGDDDDFNFYAQLNYDLKSNPVKKQFYYAMWLANGVKSLVFNKFKGIYVPLKPQSITYKDMGAKRDLILELNRLYPDLRETDLKKYNQFLQEMNKKLRIKTKIIDEDYDIITSKKKKTGYHVLELFHNYLLDELLITKKDCIITKNKNNNVFSVIFINNDETEKKINMILLNLAKGVYQVTKIIYCNQLFSDKIDEPKVLEQYEINIIKELKVNDKLLPLSITILYFEIQSK